MMMTKQHVRLGFFALTLTGLAACQPAVPDSGAGVGFGDYSEYQRQREAQLSGQANGASGLPPASAVSSEPLSPSGGIGGAGNTTGEGADIAAQTRAALNSANGTSGAGTVNASPSNPPPVAVNSAGLSRENDFDAVGEQRSIADDKALIAQNRANYTQIQPEALPSRTDTGPNIVAYALQTTHSVGQPQYRRTSLLSSEGRYQRSCAAYPSPDLAQRAFLEGGGPDRDRKGLDPDGDGYACDWDPRPFRKAAGG